ncbi:hypothetical protein [Vibrio agarivorans]|uniref:hypothetical protein n=1 Tax=Vibrio agarivorans TaxID=153622 RepID=UPI0025B3205A|nr:hypothetical protein [Vibrio agarivorans]MDN3662197.1 hypothetical protein [Vibrio agarivorans]
MNALKLNVILLLAIFFPTSFLSDIISWVPPLQSFILCVMLLITLVYKKEIYFPSLLLVTPIIILYILSTVTSPFDELAMGQLPILICWCFIVLISFSSVQYEYNRNIKYTYYLMILWVVFWGVAPLHLESIKLIYMNFYSSSYDTLLESMLAREKPVSIFGSHSLAGFFYAYFILLSIWMIKNKVNAILNIAIIIILTMMMIGLSSYTSIMMLFVVAFLSCYLLFDGKVLIYSLVLMLVFILIFLLFNLEMSNDLFDYLLGDQGNGLQSRYIGGSLKQNFEFISDNPLLGVGFTYSNSLSFTDSFFIIALTKIGILGSILMALGCLFGFRWRVDEKLDRAILSATILFAVAYPIFLYSKYLLIFVLLGNVVRNTLYLKRG